MAFDNGGVRITVSDDGVPAEGPPSSGLSGLKERAASLGGEVRAGNAPDGGFALEVELPVGEAR